MTTTRRTESEAVRKEQLLSAARKVLAERGYDKTTVSDIVKEAGVAQGTFYLYFPSKKEAVIELARQIMDQLSLRMKAAFKPDMNFEARLRLFVRTGFQVARENPDLCRLLHVGAESVGQEFRERMQAEEHPFFQSTVMMFQKAIDDGEAVPIDPDIAVRLMGRMMSGAMHEAHTCDGEGDEEKKIAEATETIIIGAFVRR